MIQMQSEQFAFTSVALSYKSKIENSFFFYANCLYSNIR